MINPQKVYMPSVDGFHGTKYISLTEHWATLIFMKSASIERFLEINSHALVWSMIICHQGLVRARAKVVFNTYHFLNLLAHYKVLCIAQFALCTMCTVCVLILWLLMVSFCNINKLLQSHTLSFLDLIHQKFRPSTNFAESTTQRWCHIGIVAKSWERKIYVWNSPVRYAKF